MIGITDGCKEIEAYLKWLDHFGFEQPYRILSLLSPSSVKDCSVVILPGGCDIGKNETRDINDFKIYEACKKYKVPVLGICRGMQVAVKAEGGQIVDITDVMQYNNHKSDDKTSRWNVIELTNGERYVVNSRHHQRVFALPILYHTMGFSKDGIPEYAEEDDKLLVQCHPELPEMWDTRFEKVVIDFLSRYEKRNEKRD